MKGRVAILCTFILVIAVSVSAQKTADVKGWNNALWGMTESDLKELFKENITDTSKKESRDGKTYYNLEIRNIDVDGVKLRVSFNMGVSDKKLKQVRLSHRVAMAESFDILEKSLTNQYGQPTSRDDSESSRNIKRSVAWHLPSTKIALSFLQTQGPLRGKYITILYSDRSFITEATDN